jgi:hypothetical protein
MMRGVLRAEPFVQRVFEGSKERPRQPKTSKNEKLLNDVLAPVFLTGDGGVV